MVGILTDIRYPDWNRLHFWIEFPNKEMTG